MRTFVSELLFQSFRFVVVVSELSFQNFRSRTLAGKPGGELPLAREAGSTLQSEPGELARAHNVTTALKILSKNPSRQSLVEEKLSDDQRFCLGLWAENVGRVLTKMIL